VIKLKLRLCEIRATITIREGKEISMEELLEMLADVYEGKEIGGLEQ
jgi:hypothetical protein